MIHCKWSLGGNKMSDLAATNCGCGCDNNGCNNGCGCSNWIWIILLLACCGNGNGCGSGYGFGNDSCCWIILLLLFCGNGNNFLGCGNGCGNGCGCWWQLSAGSAPRLFLLYKNCFFPFFDRYIFFITSTECSPLILTIPIPEALIAVDIAAIVVFITDTSPIFYTLV